MKRDPMFEISASWESPLAPEEVLAAVTKAFFVEKVTVDPSAGSVEVRSGSNLQYRLWGETLNGHKNAPVALSLTVQPGVEGSAVEVRAFDTFGFRATNRAFGGADRTFKSKLVELMETASSAVQPRNPGWS